MKLQIIAKPLLEMGKPAQVCPKCGHGPMSKTHYYYKGGWNCKHPALPGYPLTGSQAPAAPASAPAPAPTPAVHPAVAAGHAVPAPTPAPTPAAAPVASAPSQPTPAPTPAAPAPAPARQALSGSFEQKVTQFLKDLDEPVTQFTFNEDKSVSITQDVDFTQFDYEKIPMKIRNVEGDMLLAGHVKTLQNCPDVVSGDFECVHTVITSLVGGPKEVGGDYVIRANESLTSIEGAPTKVGGDFDAKECRRLVSLKGIHKMVKECNGTMNFGDTGVKESVLGLLMIRGVKKIIVPEAKVAEILNKHLGTDDIHVVQEELIDAGFASYAKM